MKNIEDVMEKLVSGEGIHSRLHGFAGVLLDIKDSLEKLGFNCNELRGIYNQKTILNPNPNSIDDFSSRIIPLADYLLESPKNIEFCFIKKRILGRDMVCVELVYEPDNPKAKHGYLINWKSNL